MAASTDDSEDDNFVVLGTPVPELAEGEAQKKPTTVKDLTARDKQGRRRFHGAFTGGFSAGYFNTVGTKEGFTPSSFLSSRSQKNQKSENMPEDFMDEEDFEEHGIAPRKFATAGVYTSEERKRKLHEDSKHLITSSQINLVPSLTDLIIPEQLPIGLKILRKMGWREGQGLGPRVKQKKKSKRSIAKMPSTKSDPKMKIYGCALPHSDHGESDSDDFVPENMSDVTFAPKDVCPISLEAKDNVHGLGYRGLDPGLALPSSHLNLFDPKPVRSRKGGKGIQGQAFGVGAFEDEDEDIYAVDNMSNYDITMQLDNDVDDKFGWTAPRDHGKQVIPVSYVGKMLEGFKLSSQSLKPKKKFQPPTLPRHFRPQHWFRRQRETSHLPTGLTRNDNETNQQGKMTAIDRGLMLGETPIMDSVFDLVPKEDKNRIEATKQAIAITQSLSGKPGFELARVFQPAQDVPVETSSGSLSLHSSGLRDSAGTSSTFLAKFTPADVTAAHDVDVKAKVTAQSDKAPLFQGNLSFQPFRKDPGKQARYDTYLTSLKHGNRDPYSSIDSSHMTEWEKARERDEFSKAAKIYRPMSAMMSTRFVRGAMIDDDKADIPMDADNEKNDQAKAADMKMFGKLTREECEWHPDKLLCRRFNVPNPYPGSDLVGLPTVKRDKYSIFNFLSFGDYQSGEMQEPTVTRSEPETAAKKTMKPVQTRKTTMASIFKVLDDPDFHKPVQQPLREAEENSEKTVSKGDADKNEVKDDSDTEPDRDLFRAIFKNSDSESSSENSADEKKEEADSEEEGNESDRSNRQSLENSKGDEQANVSKPVTEVSSIVTTAADVSGPITLLSVSGQKSEVKANRSHWGKKSIFCVLDDLDQNEASAENRQTSDGTTRTKNVPGRLSSPNSDINDEEYGPATSLATVTNSQKNTSGTETVGKTDDSREHRHKKEKKKKSKHKKGKKHKKHRKSSKSKKSRKEKNNSGSEADTENSDISDSELLQRLKKVSHGKALHVLKDL